MGSWHGGVGATPLCPHRFPPENGIQTYVSHLGDWQTFTRRVWVEMLRMRFDQAATRVVLSDGADWIRSLCTWLPFTVLLILDMFHVKKRVAEAARALHPTTMTSAANGGLCSTTALSAATSTTSCLR